jgi:cell division protein FtsW (lipid II flippase)/pSer/pThr/pTyr-binding forkhead associated (FHA) protein
MQWLLDAGVVGVRIILPFYAAVIVYAIFASMRRHRRPQKPLLTLHNLDTGEKIPVLFWENSIGRSRGSDIKVDDPSVSRDHCVLMRRQEGWFICDVGSKCGTYVNGEEIPNNDNYHNMGFFASILRSLKDNCKKGIKAVDDTTEKRYKILIDDEIQIGSTFFAVERGDEYDEEIHPGRFLKKISNKPSMKQYKLMIMITIFHLLMAVEATWDYYDDDYTPFLYCGIFVIISWGLFFVSTMVIKRTNFELEALALFLTGLGLMLQVRQEERMAIMQIVTAVAGIVCFMIIVKLLEHPDWVQRFRFWGMIAAVGLLGLNLVFGSVVNGAANWIKIGGVSIQPSEFVKILYIFVGAGTLDALMTRRNKIEFIVFSAICVGELALMGDFGTALIFFATFLFVAFMRSGDIKTVLLALATAVVGSAVIVKIKPYIAERFAVVGHAIEDYYGVGFQQANVLTYLASGGLFGVGIGNGFLKYLVASESDLVFGIVCEEIGILVGYIIVAAVLMLAVYSKDIATRSRSTFYSISACCAAGLFIVQMALNVLGATDILPLTGVTFPFVSAGGSSMISCWGLLAFIKAADERTYSQKRG